MMVDDALNVNIYSKTTQTSERRIIGSELHEIRTRNSVNETWI